MKKYLKVFGIVSGISGILLIGVIMGYFLLNRYPLSNATGETKNLKKEDLIFIGDNLETDIKLGYDAKIETIMVCSGVHTEKDIERLKVYPTRVVKNLRELIK